jgi:hypothetical protein
MLQPGSVIVQEPTAITVYNPGSGPPRQFRVPSAAVSDVDQLAPVPPAVSPTETTEPAGGPLPNGT